MKKSLVFAIMRLCGAIAVLTAIVIGGTVLMAWYIVSPATAL